VKLGLGTAQFGIDYGVTNLDGPVSREEILRILKVAEAAGISTLDTAAAYGDSEALLGETIASIATRFNVVTKLMPLRATMIGPDEIATAREGVKQSLLRLKGCAISTLLVHDAADLLAPGGERLYDLLCSWREVGLVARIGASVYDARQIEALLERYDLSVLQLPVNVFDQRLLKAGVLAELEQRGVAVHARSVFLQGVLLSRPDALPKSFARWAPELERYREYLVARSVSTMQAAIGFAAALPAVETVLIGVTSSVQLDECVTAYRKGCGLDLSEFASDDVDLLDPRKWSH